MQNRPTVICLTPVKNEAWILRRFLQCASLWADHIIIADQGSDDGSAEIARAFPKVRLIHNPMREFDGAQMRALLLDAARELPGPRLLMSLDADEVLSANFLDSPEWNTLLSAPPGTVVSLRWPIIRGDMQTYWAGPAHMPIGFMDDGSTLTSRKIHEQRIPQPLGAPHLLLQDIYLIHYVGADPARWESKHRWYQCWERLNRPQRRPIENYRFYHRIDAIPAAEIKEIPHGKWFKGYENRGVDMTSVTREPIYRWDAEVLEWFQQHGIQRFRREAVWDSDWTDIYTKIHHKEPPISLADPRSKFDRRVHSWLAYTQHHFSYFSTPNGLLSRWGIKLVEKLLKVFGW
jgi:glycosyltransferase involved in cell wall biosynthesis